MTWPAQWLFSSVLSLLMMSYNVCNRFVTWTPGRKKTSTSRPLSGKWKKGQLSERKNWLTYVSLKDVPCSCVVPNLTLPSNHWPSFDNADCQPLTLESVEILVLYSPDALYTEVFRKIPERSIFKENACRSYRLNIYFSSLISLPFSSDDSNHVHQSAF